MSLEVLEERVNPLLGRREVKLIVPHSGSGTPDRLTIRKIASDHFKTPVERVFVKTIVTRMGRSTAVCAVEVYDDTTQANIVVPNYVKNRNLPKDQRVSKKKGEQAKTATPAPSKPPVGKGPEAKPPKVAKDTKPADVKEGTAKPDAKPKA